MEIYAIPGKILNIIFVKYFSNNHSYVRSVKKLILICNLVI